MNFGNLHSFIGIFKRINVYQNLEKDLRVIGPKVATSRLAHRVTWTTGTLAWPGSDFAGISLAPSLERQGAAARRPWHRARRQPS
jgi:hypothetical protein